MITLLMTKASRWVAGVMAAFGIAAFAFARVYSAGKKAERVSVEARAAARQRKAQEIKQHVDEDVRRTDRDQRRERLRKWTR